jgi:plasmid replication initiation protein
MSFVYICIMIKKDNEAMSIVKVEKNNLSVTQSNSLIEAHYSSNLTTLAHKVAKLIIGYINPNDPRETLKVTMSITKLKYYLGWSQGTAWNRFYSDLKDIAKRLNKEPIEIPFENGKVLNAFFLSSYLLDIPKGEITFTVSPDLVPHLTALKGNFTTYQLKYIPRLTSTYAIRLYELFNQYKRIGHRQFEVDDFKKKVGAPMTYTYNDLKKRVIVPAQTQLKENTNLAFKFEEIKTGRSVTGLQFLIFSNEPTKKNEQAELNFLVESIGDLEEEPSAFSQNIIDQLESLGINEQNITAYLVQGFDIIVDTTKRAAAQMRCTTLEAFYLEKLSLLRQAKNKDNPTGFLVKALKEDWIGNSTLSVTTVIKPKETTIQRKEAEKQIKMLERQIEKLLKDKNAITEKIIANLITDENILQTAYDTVIKGMGPFFKTHLLQITHLPTLEQYKNNIFVAQSIHTELVKCFPNKFSETVALDTQLGDFKTLMEKLKKKWSL